MFYVYLLQSETSDSRWYIGYTSDLRKRLESHNSGGSQSTRGCRWRLVYYEAYLSAKTARQREYRLKHDGRSRRYVMERIRNSKE